MAKRGRKPKPTAAKIRAGNPGRRALNQNEPKPKLRAPPCPRHLDKVARAEWRRVCRELLELGILTSIDRSVLIAYCESWSLYVAAHAKVAEEGSVLISEKTGAPYQSPYLSQMTAAMKAMVGYAVELGMTPSARSRVQVQPPKKANDKKRFFKIAG